MHFVAQIRQTLAFESVAKNKLFDISAIVYKIAIWNELMKWVRSIRVHARAI